MLSSVINSIFCIIVLGIVLLGINFQKILRDDTVVQFTRIIYSTVIYLILCIISDLCEGNPDYEKLNFCTNLLMFFAIDFIVLSFTRYLHTLITPQGEKQLKLLDFAQILCLLRMCLTIVLVATGNVFTIENGVYVEKELVYVPYIVSVVIMLLLISIILLNRKCFTRRQLIVIIIYQLLPVIPVVIELFSSIYSLTGTGITISILMIYVLLQDTTLERSTQRQIELETIINKDELTGAYKRKTFFMKTEGIDGEKPVGVLFCNINGLRFINDENGFQKGDEILKNFAELALNVFGDGSLFRISGDEFVIVYNCETKNDFILICEKLRTEIVKNNTLAAMGYSFGKGSDFFKLLSEAEDRMNLDKAFNSPYFKKSK